MAGFTYAPVGLLLIGDGAAAGAAASSEDCGAGMVTERPAVSASEDDVAVGGAAAALASAVPAVVGTSSATGASCADFSSEPFAADAAAEISAGASLASVMATGWIDDRRYCLILLASSGSNGEQCGHPLIFVPFFLRLASELYPGVSGGFLGKVWLACLLREDFKIFPAMPSTN